MTPRATLLALLCLMCWTTAEAQNARCSDLLVEANQTYSRGAFDETIALLDRCMALPDVTEAERRTAYRLKGLCYIGKGLEVDARESVRRLLTLVPDYEPDPAMDPPNFVTLIQEVRQELDTTLTPETQAAAPAEQPAQTRPPVTQPVVTSRRSRGGAGKYVLAGLGVGAVGGLAYLLLKGDGSSSGGEPISSPPALPQ
ncbi:MAG: hypothetical protein R2834_11860 [Rhodothermales bacterium]